MEDSGIILCDTNIIIAFFKGDANITNRLRQIRQENIAISSISTGELIFGALNRRELNQILKHLAKLNTLHLDESISKKCIELMTNYSLSHNLSLPDALIAATAIHHKTPLYTLNTRDFRYINGLDLH